MSKFGELIDSEMPILLDFYTDWNEASTSMHPVLKDVAAAIGDKGKVIKINVFHRFLEFLMVSQCLTGRKHVAEWL